MTKERGKEGKDGRKKEKWRKGSVRRWKALLLVRVYDLIKTE